MDTSRRRLRTSHAKTRQALRESDTHGLNEMNRAFFDEEMLSEMVSLADNENLLDYVTY